MPAARRFTVAGVLLIALVAMRGELRAGEISFAHDVMAVLSKAGCNLGTCHGNANGKGGFKLSLRGQDPQLDFLALTHDQMGRRVDVNDADRSLILRKATMQTPHEGGLRFARNSSAYSALRRWIAAGAPSDMNVAAKVESLVVTPREQFVVEPNDTVQIRATARFADGIERDVTATAVYETSNKLVEVAADGQVQRVGLGETTVLVRYLNRQVPVRLAFVAARPDFKWPAEAVERNFIDEQVFTKLRSMRIPPAPLCDDVAFLRRAYLDLIGFLPDGVEAQAFLNDASADKRDKLIDQLLDRPEFADFWALKFADLLRVEEKTLDRKGVQNFHAWIRRTIEHDEPLNRFAAELIAGRGNTYTSPAANFYRSQADTIMQAESAAQVFLGVRLQCAKCHNHPFDRWTQTDYYRWANLFARVEYKRGDNSRYDKNDKRQFDGVQVVLMGKSGDYNDPRTGEPRPPRVLGSRDDLPTNVDRLDALAAWLADPANPFFAKAQANRVWFHLMGRGIVDPIDDFRATNPPSHPALLDALSADFAKHEFRLKPLIRTIMQSRTYQLSAETNEANRDDEVNYSHALVRSLSAEQVLDSLVRVTGGNVKFMGYPSGLRAGQLPGVHIGGDKDPIEAGDRFLRKFGKPPRLMTCECERSPDVALGQVFELIGGPIVLDLISQPSNRIDDALAKGKSDASTLAGLYWHALSRRPTEEERERLLRYVKEAEDKRLAWQDVVWALVNSKEFLLRR